VTRGNIPRAGLELQDALSKMKESISGQTVVNDLGVRH